MTEMIKLTDLLKIRNQSINDLDNFYVPIVSIDSTSAANYATSNEKTNRKPVLLLIVGLGSDFKQFSSSSFTHLSLIHISQGIVNNFLLLLLHTALIKNPVQLTPFQHETLLVQALRNLYYQQNPRANGSYAYLPALMGTHYESYDTRYIPLGELSLILLIFILWFLSIALCLSKYRKLRSLHPFIPPYPGDPPMHIEEGLLFWIKNGSKSKKDAHLDPRSR